MEKENPAYYNVSVPISNFISGLTKEVLDEFDDTSREPAEMSLCGTLEDYLKLPKPEFKKPEIAEFPHIEFSIKTNDVSGN